MNKINNVPAVLVTVHSPKNISQKRDPIKRLLTMTLQAPAMSHRIQRPKRLTILTNIILQVISHAKLTYKYHGLIRNITCDNLNTWIVVCELKKSSMPFGPAALY